MGLNTPFISENTGSPVYDFGFYKIQRHTKFIIVDIIKNFISSMVKEYSLTMPDILDIQTTTELEKIFVNVDFPYTERKLPLIVVSLRDGMKEKKMYMGADNLIGYKVLGTSTAQKTVEVYGGAATIPINVTIIALSPDDRMKLAEILNICFTHYYRWQYYYTLEDGNQFSIVPNSETIDFNGESEVADTSKTSMLYVINMTMTAFVEYTFTSLDQVGRINNATITGEVIEASGESPEEDPYLIGSYSSNWAPITQAYDPYDIDLRSQMAVDPGNTETIDTINFTTNHACKWALFVRSSQGNFTGEVIGLEAGGQAFCTVYGFLGTDIDFSVDVTTDGSSLSLVCTNNEPEAITINFSRIRI